MEELKGMEKLLEKCKGHNSSLVTKFKELEEKNKRLMDYNVKLRAALVESHLLQYPHHRLVNIPDGDNEMPSYVTEELLSSVFTNAGILHNIFGYLDVKDLQGCRIICEKWDRIASSILRQTNNGYGQAIHFDFNQKRIKVPPAGFISPPYQLFRVSVPDPAEPIRVGELHSIVKTARKDWFRTVKLHDYCLNRPEFAIVLKDFGNQLQFVLIEGCDLKIQELQNILVNYCQNLEKLKLLNANLIFGGEASELNIPANRTLKLLHLSLNIQCSAHDCNQLSQVFIKIIKSSPNLETLEFWGSDTSYCTPVFKELKFYPHIMSNLETIFFPNRFPPYRNAQESDPLKEFSEIKFQPKLKRLVLTNITRNDGLALSTLLKKSAESLKQLTLISDYETHTIASCPPDMKLEFSRMNNLQEFKYLISREIPIDSIDFLTKMPNLKDFMVSFENPYSLTFDRKCLLDRLLFNCSELLVTPHINLKKLSLFGFIEKPTTIFGLISKCFPNLTKLGVAFTKMKPLQLNSDPEDNYNEDFFKGLAELKNLNHLYLQWNDRLNNDWEEFMEGFKSLKNVAKLTHLTIQTGCGIDDFKDVLFESVPKLKRLTLLETTISLEDVLNFRELLFQRNISLEVQDESYCETDSYNLEWDSYITDFSNSYGDRN